VFYCFYTFYLKKDKLHFLISLFGKEYNYYLCNTSINCFYKYPREKGGSLIQNNAKARYKVKNRVLATIF
uniref:hypothetical protein n=2 Tax=Proteus TaxID=583 RepID=UPI0019543A2D